MKQPFGAGIFLAGSLALAARAAHAQDEMKKLDDFESELSGWTALKLDDKGAVGADEESKVAITRDAQHVKAGKGALSYAYDISPAAFRLLSIQRPKDFTGMKSLRFWVKCTSSTAIQVTLNETGGARYQAAVYCLAGAWQEVALDVDELTLEDPSKSRTGKIDLDEIEHFQIMDLGSFLVRFLPDLKGPRILWLDDVGLSPKPAIRTTGATKSASGAPIYLVDSFESPVIRWSPVSLELSEAPRINVFDSPLAIDADAAPEGGRHSLRMTYTRQAAKLHGLLRSLEKVDLKKAKGLELSLKTSQDGTFLVGIEAKDGARYQQIVALKASEGWKKLSYALDSFGPADENKDKTAKLDPGQIKEMSVADLTTLLGAGAGAGVENVLRLDEVRFTLRE